MKIPLVTAMLLLLFSCQESETHFEKSWSSVNDRVWIGSEFWSNRLQDWKIQNGRLECVANNSRLLMRTTHLVNCRLASNDEDFVMKVDVGALQSSQNDDAACGILIGAGSTLDVWGASLIQQSTGPGGGLFAGITASGNLFVKDMEDGKILGSTPCTFSERNTILVELSHQESNYHLTLKCAGEEVILTGVNKERLIGNVAVVSDPGTGEQPGSFWFNSLEMSGRKLQKLEGRFGPIISTQYTLSNHLLKLTAQMAPLGEADPKEVSIEINRDGSWQEISKTKIITPGYTATFRISDWDASLDLPYRVKYLYQSSNNRSETAVWEGTIKRDPIEKEEIVIAGFTGNHNNASPGLSGIGRGFKFNYNGIWYPHIEVVENVRIHEPDVLFFSGDQVYQGNSPTAPDMKNYELDYLYKWYLYCLAYRSLTKDIPTISIPDDHDVYQGNLWGQNGRSTDRDNKGGYVHPAWFVQMVERTQCSNLPDPYDPTPIDQNIGVYYTSLSYGGIGFAVLEDRKFKSGCADNPFVGSGRPDHIVDPGFMVHKIDLPGKKLLGDRQLEFLDDWACDWKDQEMKIALSQTIFANMATHHGARLDRVFGDLDSNGWPQTGRDKALDALRKGFVFHLAGDQHLASIVHHGIDEWDDAIYSFCVPSVANFYPRAWWPESIGADREKGAPQNMGRHRDGFGNLVSVYGVANPTKFTKKSSKHEPLILHDRMPGYGIVKMNKRNRTITMECWPRYANPEIEDQQYEGWPKTISQFENYGRKAYAYLPTISVEGTEDPVVEIRDEQGGALVYCVRIAGREFKPKVFKQSSYKVTIKDTEKEIVKVLEGVLPDENSDDVITVRF